MAKFKGPFFYIDREIFKGVNNLLVTPVYQKTHDQIAALPEDQLKIINYSLTTLVICLPLIFAISMYFTNQSMRSDLAIRKEILTTIQKFDSKNSIAEDLGRKALSPHTISNQEGFEKRIKKTLDRKKIAHDKVEVKSFKQVPGEIVKSEAVLKFKDFTLSNLYDFFLAVLQSEKMKIASLNIKKDKTLNLLNGRLEVVHYGK